jgi:hypothetical protein
MSEDVVFDIPTDRELLAALGEVALRQEHLNHVLKMILRKLADLTVQEVLDATQWESSKRLRERISRIGRKRLGEGQSVLKLQALIERAKRATDKRNEYVHTVWARGYSTGNPILWGAGDRRTPQPTIQELKDLAGELELITLDAIGAHIDGFLDDALRDEDED